MIQQRHHRAESVALAGNLGEIALSDVVQLIANDRRAGMIRVESTAMRGIIWFDAGNILRAELGGRSGADAFYAAMTLDEGHFSIVFDATCSHKNVDVPIYPLLMEGARRIDECNRIRAALETDRYDFATTLAAPQDDDDLAVAFLFGAPCPVDVALSRCAIGELEVLETIARLVEARVLQPVPRASLAPATMRLAAVAA